MAWKETYTTQAGEKRYRIGARDSSGKKHSKSFLRSKDADAYMLEVTRKEQLGHLWQDTPQTFGEFAGVHVNEKNLVRLTGDGWFSRYEQTVRKSSFDRRKDVIKHLRELLPMRLDRLTPALIEDTVAAVYKAHPRQGTFVHDTIRMILRSAAIRGQTIQPGVLVLKSPAYSPARERKALTLEEVEALAEASDEPHLVRVAAYTGLRQGELFALRDEDIDLEAGTISVTGTVYRGVRGEPKTKSSRRTVFVPREVVRELKAQLLRRPTGTSIVFPEANGGYWHHHHFDVPFRIAVADTGLGITFHDLRHTFVSLMVAADVHPKQIQEAAGHANFNITMNLYTHLKDAQRTDAADALGRLLAGEA